jgi:hypothetical protein
VPRIKRNENDTGSPTISLADRQRVAGALLEGRAASAVTTDLRVQAIAFDAFPVFDPRPVFAQAERFQET